MPFCSCSKTPGMKFSPTDRKEIWKRLLATLIKPMVTAEWWQKEMNVLEGIVGQVPCYTMQFDQSGAVVEQLQSLVRARVTER